VLSILERRTEQARCRLCCLKLLAQSRRGLVKIFA
jgi:hypothetical protein